MRCMNPLTASLNHNGDIVYSTKLAIPGLLPFQFECRKCLPCRLNIAREKAIRCVHEAKMHQDNIFLTLTYRDGEEGSQRLIYDDFKSFMKRLREKAAYDYAHQNNIDIKEARKIKYLPFMVTGEYGDKTKRPHWHAIIFNYKPSDAKYFRSNKLGSKIFKSKLIEDLWQKGFIEFGDVTIDSAGYVARYAAKKLTHGKDDEHDYQPIHRTASKRAIGKTWIEKYYKHTFDNGFVLLPNKQKTKIPRYYVDWLKKEKPDLYLKYATGIRKEIIRDAEKKQRKEEIEFLSDIFNHKGIKSDRKYPLNRQQVKHRILKRKFKRLQETLKL